jgi:hypothetical protein
MMASLTDAEKKLLAKKSNYYLLHFSNVGGLIMPIIFRMEFEDGSAQEVRLPAEAWRVDSSKFTKMIVTEKKVVRFELDPHRETADVDRNNNYFPPELEPTRFEVFKGSGAFGGRGGRRMTPNPSGENPSGNPMRESRRSSERQRPSEAAPNADTNSVSDPSQNTQEQKKEPEKKESDPKEPEKKEPEKKEPEPGQPAETTPAATGGN